MLIVLYCCYFVNVCCFVFFFYFFFFQAEDGIRDLTVTGVQTCALPIYAFMISYTIMYGAGGWVMDKLGMRRGLSLSVIWWSVASCLQAFARGAFSLGFFRVLLGMGEGGNWPAFAKAISMWVPKKMQALAIGIANSGSSVGSAIAAPLIAWLTIHWGWRFAFFLTGTFGFFWLGVWLWATHQLEKISPELASAQPLG